MHDDRGYKEKGDACGKNWEHFVANVIDVLCDPPLVISNSQLCFQQLFALCLLYC